MGATPPLTLDAYARGKAIWFYPADMAVGEEALNEAWSALMGNASFTHTTLNAKKGHHEKRC